MSPHERPFRPAAGALRESPTLRLVSVGALALLLAVGREFVTFPSSDG